MKHRSKAHTVQHINPMGKSRNNIRSLITKNAELEKRLADLEASFGQLESKAFEVNARVGQAELRAGRADMRAAESSERAGQAEAKSIQAEAKSIQAEEKSIQAEAMSVQADGRSIQAEERSIQAEARAIQLEKKWMKITRVVKMPFRAVRLIVRLPGQLFGEMKTRTASSPDCIEEPLPDSDLTNTASDHKDQSTSLSPRAQQIYQNLKTAQTQQKDREECVSS